MMQKYLLKKKEVEELYYNFRIPKSRCNVQEIRDQLTIRTHNETDFFFYDEDEEYIQIPRAFGINMFPNFISKLDNGEDRKLVFEGDLKPFQKNAVDKTLSKMTSNTYSNGILNLACGLGKTVCSLYIICKLKRKSLILVHRKMLLDQWVERIRSFIPDGRVTVLDNKKIQKSIQEGDITLVMMQTLHNMGKKNREILGHSYGLCVIDEAHIVPARTFNSALQCINTAHILALTATPRRNDGLTKCLRWLLGDIYVSMKESDNPLRVEARIMKYTQNSTMCKRFGNKDPMENYAHSMLQKWMGDDNSRNQMVASEIIYYYKQERKLLVLSKRIKQLEYLQTIVKVPNSCILTGKSNKACRDGARDMDIIYSTYALFKEGIDMPELDTLIFAMPSSDVEQACGRIMRYSINKKDPVIVDIIDDLILCKNYYKRRQRFYNSHGIKIRI